MAKNDKSIFYTSVDRRGDNIFLRYKTNTGESYKQKVAFKPSFYINSNADITAHGIYGETLSEVKFDTIKEASGFLEKYRGFDGFSVYGQRDFPFQFIAKHFPGKLEYFPEYIKRLTLDIEVFSGTIEVGVEGELVAKAGPAPFGKEAELARFPISAITIQDNLSNTYYTFGLEEFDGHYLGTFDINALDEKTRKRVEHLNIVYKGFKDESELLMAFLSTWESLDADSSTGWNNVAFDMYYMVNRINNILGESQSKRLSPFGFVNTRTMKTKYGETPYYEIVGCPNIDYQDVMKKHGFISPDNWKLGTVGEHIVGEGKVDFEVAKTLNTLYVIDFNKYIAYNICDVELLIKIEAKKGLFGLMYSLQYLLKCNLDDVLATIRPWSAFAYEKYHAQGIEPEIKAPGESRSFIGGYVKEPIVGKKGWTISIDANSLNI